MKCHQVRELNDFSCSPRFLMARPLFRYLMMLHDLMFSAPDEGKVCSILCIWFSRTSQSLWGGYEHEEGTIPALPTPSQAARIQVDIILQLTNSVNKQPGAQFTPFFWSPVGSFFVVRSFGRACFPVVTRVASQALLTLEIFPKVGFLTLLLQNVSQ